MFLSSLLSYYVLVFLLYIYIYTYIYIYYAACVVEVLKMSLRFEQMISQRVALADACCKVYV